MVSKRNPSLLAALVMPANVLALAAGAVASYLMHDSTPVIAAGSASFLYLAMLSLAPSFRRVVRANLERQAPSTIAAPEEHDALVSELAPSQREHYLSLQEVKGRILESYGRMPGGRVLVASSERRLEALLTSFLRLVATLNSYRKFLSAADRQSIQAELELLEGELLSEPNERLREVKSRRVDILRKRLQRFVQAEESREVVSHQLASIEDVLKLTHEQSIAIRDPELVGRQLEALTSEVAATEETVREMEHFMQISEELGGSAESRAAPQRVR
jgi:hypothetical protein